MMIDMTVAYLVMSKRRWYKERGTYHGCSRLKYLEAEEGEEEEGKETQNKKNEGGDVNSTSPHFARA